MKYKLKPSISDLLDLLNKPALLSWANRLGLEGQSLAAYRQSLMRDGLSRHKEIERWFEDKTPFEEPAFQTAFEAFFSDKEILAWEKNIESDEYTGRLDVKYRWNGLVYVADFKSNQTGLYLENKLQLSGYRKAECADRVAIIGIPAMNHITVEIMDFEPYERCLSLLVQLFHLKSKL